jgi:hypothetical protein
MAPRAVSEFQDTLGELAARSGEATAKLIAGISELSPYEARAFITDAYPAMLDPFLSASATLTTQWYAEQPTVTQAAGAKVFVPEPAPMVPGEQLAISGRWALTTPNPALALQGNATRQVMNASRDTVIVNATNEGVRWVRQAKLNACGFCKMLATRAAKDLKKYSYGSEGIRRDAETGDYITVVIGKRGRTRGKRKLGSKYHDSCRCIAVMLRDNSYEPPEYVQQWTEQYDAIVAKEGTGDLYKISQLMDAGRVRADRLPALADAADDLFSAVATTEDAIVELDAEPANATKAPARTLDEVEAEFNAAIASGADDSIIDQLAGEMLDIEAAEARRAANRARAANRRDAAGSANFERMSQLIEEGLDPIEAEATAFGISEATVRSRTILSEARSNGYQVKSVEDLVKQVFMEKASEAYAAAEEATNGYMVKRKFVGKVDPSNLWYATEKQARRWMSDEMAAWFDANGRITKAAVRAMIRDGDQVLRDPMTRDFLR